MTTDLIDILVKIVEGMNNNYSIDRIVKNLNRDKKVNKNLVAAIYSWIFDKIHRDLYRTVVGDDSAEGIRFLSEEEKDILGIENSNYILHLYNLRLLNNSDIDRLIEQAQKYAEGELDFEQLNIMILAIFLETNSELPPGSRLLLYSSDTIN